MGRRRGLLYNIRTVAKESKFPLESFSNFVFLDKVLNTLVPHFTQMWISA